MPTDPCTVCGKRCRLCQVCHKRRANFGPATATQPVRCQPDKLPSDITFVNAGAACEHPDGCTRQKHYGPPGGRKIHCGTHKAEGELNLSQAHCSACLEEDGLDVLAGFGPVGEKPSRCSKHQKPGDTDLKNKKCIECNDSVASYRHNGRMDYCARCAKELNLEVRNAKVPYCITCDKHIATFGIYKPEYCKACMDSAIHRDVRSKMCTSCENHQAQWGSIGGPYERCSNCAFPSDILLKNGCTTCYKKNGCFHSTGGKLVCGDCKRPGDKNPYATFYPCSSCGLDLSKSVDALCEYCLPGSRLDRSFEKQVALFLKENLADHPRINLMTFNSSRGIGKECGSRRPDILMDVSTFFVDVEVDEHQHNKSSYKTSCEENRADNISDALGLPGVFIRFNVHPYVNAAGMKVDTPLADRKAKLLEVILKILEDDYRDPETIYLFYDETPIQKRKAESIHVAAFNSEDVCVGKFLSISAAARHLNADNDSIRRAVKDSNATSAGYKWKPISAEDYEDLEVRAQIVLRSGSRGTKVKMIEPVTNEVMAIFDSGNAAARSLGLNKKSISNAVKSDEKCCGFFWAHVEDGDVVDVAQEASIERAKKQKRSRK